MNDELLVATRLLDYQDPRVQRVIEERGWAALPEQHQDDSVDGSLAHQWDRQSLHGATIHKRLQKGVVDGFFHRPAPNSIVHSWAEVPFEGRWVAWRASSSTART